MDVSARDRIVSFDHLGTGPSRDVKVQVGLGAAGAGRKASGNLDLRFCRIIKEPDKLMARSGLSHLDRLVRKPKTAGMLGRQDDHHRNSDEASNKVQQDYDRFRS